MKERHTDRFKGASWFGKQEPIIVGGAGGLGSWLTLALCRQGQEKIAVYDFDTVSETNIGGQFFKTDQVGQPKVEALRQACIDYADTTIYAYNDTYSETSMRSNVMFACFDNMLARRLMFLKWRINDDRKLFVDIRLDFEQIDIYCITKDTELKYHREHLPTDDEVPDALCTMKQTTHLAMTATGLATGLFTNYLGEDYRSIPFHTRYVVPMNYFKDDLS